MSSAPYYVGLLHDGMVDKNGKLVTTSVTLIDVHDIARSCTTYGVRRCYVTHPSPTMRGLVGMLKTHWDEGFGERYNPNRKEALDGVVIRESLDSLVEHVTLDAGQAPVLIATSARGGEGRISYLEARERIAGATAPHIVLFGTGWGMSDTLMARSNFVIEPIHGPGNYNHLSVRAACAITLDRLFARAA